MEERDKDLGLKTAFKGLLICIIRSFGTISLCLIKDVSVWTGWNVREGDKPSIEVKMKGQRQTIMSGRDRENNQGKGG